MAQVILNTSRKKYSKPAQEVETEIETRRNKWKETIQE